MSKEENDRLIEYLTQEGVLQFYLIALSLFEIFFDEPMDSELKEKVNSNRHLRKLVEMSKEQIIANDSFTSQPSVGSSRMIRSHAVQYHVGGITGLAKNIVSRNVRPKNWKIYVFPDRFFGLNQLFSRVIWFFARLRNK